MTLLEFPSTRSSLTILCVKKKLPQGVPPNLRALVVLVAMALLASVAPVHAETVPLSALIANPSAEITGPAGLRLQPLYIQLTAATSLLAAK
ncbi:MAG: hypothetical protein M3Z35_01960 [Nitrospirota bacterium]|nr:hypothetical protein [Nitrospirota bacterium]